MNLKMKRFGILLLLPAAVMLSSCRQEERGQIQISHKTIDVQRSDRILNAEYSARIKGKQFVEVRPQVGGAITKICFEEGDLVSRGQLLFIIDQAPYKAALMTAEANVRSAEAKLANAHLDFESKKDLYKENVISDFELQTAEIHIKELEAQLSQAKAHEFSARNDLSYTEVRSPASGRTSMIPYRVGALVNSSIAEPLVTVTDISTVYAYFSISEKQILDMSQNYGSLQKALEGFGEISLEMSNGSLYPIKGKIDAISGTVDESTGAISVRASFSNPDHLLLNGAMGKIIIPEKLENCIVIPQSATYELQDKIFAYKVVDGKAVSAPIKVFRLNDGHEYIVESGLETGDVIIAEGAGLIREGMKIVTDKKEEQK